MPNKNGGYVIFDTSQSGQKQLDRDTKTQLNVTMDMKDVPAHLKCALSDTFLREAVCLPCCGRCVNDSTIRQELISKNLKCPLCGTPNIYPDSVRHRSIILSPII